MSGDRQIGKAVRSRYTRLEQRIADLESKLAHVSDDRAAEWKRAENAEAKNERLRGVVDTVCAGYQRGELKDQRLAAENERLRGGCPVDPVALANANAANAKRAEQAERQLADCRGEAARLLRDNERIAEANGSLTDAMLRDSARADKAEQENERLKTENLQHYNADERRELIGQRDEALERGDRLQTRAHVAERQLADAREILQRLVDAGEIVPSRRLAAILKQETTIDGNG